MLPTITHIHMSVIPVLAGGGTIFLDSRAHKTIYDGCALAQARGATVERFAHENLDHLEALLRDSSWRRPGMICIDGVNSMTGNAPDLAAFAALAREHDVILYVDDAHGFGVIGERSPDEPCDYGVRGNSIVRHAARVLRERRPRRRLLQGLLVAARLHRLPDGAQAGAQDRRAAVPVLGTVAGGLARHRARGPPRQRRARRSASGQSPSPHPARPGSAPRARASIPRTTRDSRSSRCRWPTRTASTRSATCCSTAAST